MQVFPFDQDDWYGFAGAEPTPEGNPPCLGWTPWGYCLVDNAGLFLAIVNEEGQEEQAYFLPTSYKIAMKLADILSPQNPLEVKALANELGME
jgi:hypothetical protein